MAISLIRTRAVLSEQLEAGLHLGAQVAVELADGRSGSLALGQVRPGAAMTVQSLPVWMSAGKPIAAVALAQLRERGKLSFDDPIIRFIPAFGQNGKSDITLRHILTHTAGFRFLPLYTWPDDWDQIIADLCAMPIEPGWTPGQTAGYHPLTSWFILGEVISRVDGRSYDRYVREEIYEPLDMFDCWTGMPLAVYEQVRDRVALPYQTRRQPPAPLPQWEGPHVLTLPRPGSNTTGPASQFVRFYQMLLNRGRSTGGQLLTEDSVRELTSPARVGLFDKTFNQPIDWGLGFQVNTAQDDSLPYTLGQTFSARAFSHGGNQCSIAFADPATGVAAAIFCHGMPGEPAHHTRMRAILPALAEDLRADG